MDVHVCETGKKETIIEFNDGNAVAGDKIADETENTAAAKLNVRIDKGAAGENAAALDDEIHDARPFPAKTSNFQ